MAQVKLTADVIASIADAVRVGADRVQACAAAGIPFELFREWVRLGEKGTQPFALMLRTVEKAEVEQVMRHCIERQWVMLAAFSEAQVGEFMRTHDADALDRFALTWGRIARAHGLLP
jgi:hypothetical protein